MTDNIKPFDLAERTLLFAQQVRDFTKTVPHNMSNIEYVKQLIRSSASVGANYIEASESFSKKDFLMRLKISRKEAKESIYWLKLIEVHEVRDDEVKVKLINESTELMKIFGAIITK